MWIIGYACFSSLWESESRFVSEAKDKILSDFASFFWHSLAREGARMPWVHCMDATHGDIQRLCEQG